MSPNLIELNTKIDSDDVTFFDAKSIIEHECSVCAMTSNESSQSCRACKEFFRRSNINLKEKKQLKQFSPKCIKQPCNIKNSNFAIDVNFIYFYKIIRFGVYK